MKLLTGDCVKHMQKLPADSVDSIVCDPPYGLEFMGKEWDKLGDVRQPGDPTLVKSPGPIGRSKVRYGGTAAYRSKNTAPRQQEWHYRWAVEAFRVAKPGTYLVAFGGTRTFHRLTCALEDAGWEIRDCLMFCYGSGFPKSHDVSKAIDRAAGAEQVVGTKPDRWTGKGSVLPLSPVAKQWSGWGTALKPAWEPIILARKPLSGTVVANVKKHGTGALNIDATRIDTEGRPHRIIDPKASANGSVYAGRRNAGAGFDGGSKAIGTFDLGRWPANVILDEEAGEMLDEQSGETVSAGGQASLGAFRNGLVYGVGRDERESRDPGFGDVGGASRFFYCAKASRAEREEGLEELQSKPGSSSVRVSPTDNMTCAACGRTHPASYRGSCQRCGADALAFAPSAMDGRGRGGASGVTRNHHPTVKPVALMRWLCLLVTPKGGTVLDPFMGSGSTGIAARLSNFDFIGIDKDKEYVKIATARIDAYQRYEDMATHPSLPPITNAKAEEFFA
jgi:site-specific DNA-methyltransferase (adenine-specific)